MRTFRIGDLAALQAGSLSGAAIDQLFDAANGQPALVPAPDFTSAAFLAASDPHWGYDAGWSAGATSTPGSVATFSYVGVGCILSLQSAGTSGIGWLLLDGSPYLALDSYAAEGFLAPWLDGNTATIQLSTSNGGAHVVTLTYEGDVNAAVQPVGPVADTVGTSVGPLLQPVRQNRGATTDATWTVAAVDATHVSIDGTGSYALGTTVTGVVSGVALTLLSGTMTTGDAATFSTTASGLTIDGAYVATRQATGATFTAPVVSSTGTLPLAGLTLPLAEPGALPGVVTWLAAAWEEDPDYPVQAGWAATGNTLNPADPAWATTPAVAGFDPAKLAIAHDGLGHGYMGLAVLPPGCYCQPGLALPDGGYVRNLRLYAWDPDTDPDRRRYPPVPDDDLARRLYASLAVGWTILERDPMRELRASCSVGGAVGALLDMRGAEWGLPRPFGLTDPLYAQLLRFLAAAKTQGGTLAFFQRALGLLLGADAHFSVQSLAGTTTGWVLGTSALGVDTVLGSYVPNAWEAQVTIQVSSLNVPPQIVQAIISTFKPVGVSIIWLWD